MQRSRRIALAALCVLALTIGAATLTETTTTTGGGGGEPSFRGETGDWYSPPTFSFLFDEDDRGNELSGPAFGRCIEFLQTTTFYLLVFGFLLLLSIHMYRKGGILLVISVIGVIITPGFLVWALFTTCEMPTVAGAQTQALNMSAADGGLFGDQTGVLPSDEPGVFSAAILVLVAVLVVSLALFLIRTTGDDGDVPAPAEEPEPEDPMALADIASVAGDAADRIETGGVDAENEVYRAWREMTTHLDVMNPDTATPAEFRDAARDAGMAPRHVDALTELFREVRYGGADPTPDREDAAVDALRAIENAYGGTDGP